MKKLIILLCLFGALLTLITSCDSLWVVRDDASVIFDLNLKEVIGTGEARSGETSLLHSKSLIPDIADEGYDVFISLHTASSDKVIASDILTVEEAENSNIVFEGIAANETVYAKIEISQSNTLIFRARTLDTKLKRGENLLLARPNAMFISWAGLSVSLGADPLNIESVKPFGLEELQFAYEYMSIDGKLLQDSMVYVSQSLSLKESEETWTFPGLSVVFENGINVEVVDGNTLTLQNISLIGEEVVVSVQAQAFLNLAGNLHIDGIMYNPTENPLKVTGNISSNSRIILVPIDNDSLTAGTVLVEKAGGNFTRDNFIVPAGVTAIIKDGNLVVADESDISSLITYSFNSSSNSYTVTGADSSLSGDITIPATYNDGVNGEHSVTAIGNGIFTRNNNITKIILPESINNIGSTAFYECRNLQSINIPENITTIGERAFYACTALESIIIPDTITTINMGTFNSCSSLKTVTIGSDSLLSTIGSSAFKGTSITEINLPSKLQVIEQEAFNGSSLSNVTIPSSGEEIGAGAFLNNNSLTLTIPGTVRTVGATIVSANSNANITVTGVASAAELPSTWASNWHNGAVVTYSGGAGGVTYTVTFDANGGTLNSASPSSIDVAEGETLTLPAHPTHVNENFTGWYTVSGYSQQKESNVFSGKTPVTESITVYARWMTDNSDTNYTYTLNPSGDSFTAVGKNTALSDSISLPSNYSHKPVTVLGDNGYENYTNARFITLNSGVIEIGASAFVGCTSLEHITIPDTIIKIGANAFSSLQTWATVSAVNGQGTLAGFSSTENSITAEFATWKEIPADTVVYPIWQ